MAGDNSPAPRVGIHLGHPRVAFYGKCGSTRNAPLSLLRQLHAVATALLGPTLISACFADIGVWNRRGDDTPRVLSLAGRRVHGGLVELLRQAHDPNRGFDVVACVDESRLPRRVSEHQAVLQEFAEYGVRSPLSPPPSHRTSRHRPPLRHTHGPLGSPTGRSRCKT